MYGGGSIECARVDAIVFPVKICEIASQNLTAPPKE